MYEIFSKTDDRTANVSADSTILEALLEADINQIHVCGGNARCTTCRVYVTDGIGNCKPRNSEEEKLAKRLCFPDNIRLACQTKIVGNISIRRSVIDDLDKKIIASQFSDDTGTVLGLEKFVAILFTDIENYTQFAEHFPAYDVVHVLTRYYQTMNTIIEQHKGIISDVAGDGILALFGVKESQNSVANAISAVRAMNVALGQFNEYLEHMYGRSFGIRAGINFGRAIIGNFNIGKMSKIAAIGDAVNMAGRIESANKGFGTKLLISESAYQEIQGTEEACKVHTARLQGKSGEHALYELKI